MATVKELLRAENDGTLREWEYQLWKLYACSQVQGRGFRA